MTIKQKLSGLAPGREVDWRMARKRCASVGWLGDSGRVGASLGSVTAAGAVHHWDGSGSVTAAGAVHHWDGSFDSAASLTASKEHVPTDGTRALYRIHEMRSLKKP